MDKDCFIYCVVHTRIDAFPTQEDAILFSNTLTYDLNVPNHIELVCFHGSGNMPFHEVLGKFNKFIKNQNQ